MTAFHLQATLKRFVVLLSKGAKGPVDLCSARTEVERRLDLRFLRCILHRLRRNADWMWERTLICQNQRMRDSHNAHRRRKKRKKDIPEP